MPKVIEFYVRDLFPKKVRSAPRDQLGKVIEFPKDKPALDTRFGNHGTDNALVEPFDCERQYDHDNSFPLV
jgi:hypothetical protein